MDSNEDSPEIRGGVLVVRQVIQGIYDAGTVLAGVIVCHIIVNLFSGLFFQNDGVLWVTVDFQDAFGAVYYSGLVFLAVAGPAHLHGSYNAFPGAVDADGVVVYINGSSVRIFLSRVSVTATALSITSSNR